MQMSAAMTVRCENLAMIESTYTDDLLSIIDYSLKIADLSKLCWRLSATPYFGA